MVTMIVSLSLRWTAPFGPPKKERGFYATHGSCATFLQVARLARTRGGSAAREPRRHAPLEGSHEGPQATALHALHDALHLQELLEQAVHVLNLDAGAGGDAPPARAVDDSGVAPLPPRHGIDDGDLAPHLPVALIGRHRTLFHRRPRQLVDERPDATHLLQLFELAAQVEHVEALALDHLLRQALRLVVIDLAVHLFDQRHHVTHAEDARGHALGVERLEGLGFLAHPHEHDRLAGDLPHRQ